METPRMRTHLVGACAGHVCREPACPHAVRQNPYDGRWYVTMGHAGFNTKANNANGYATQAAAAKTVQKHLK